MPCKYTAAYQHTVFWKGSAHESQRPGMQAEHDAIQAWNPSRNILGNEFVSGFYRGGGR